MKKLSYPFGAVCLVLNANNEVLVVSRRYNKDVLCLPGGRQDPGESIIKTASRELYEETGLIISEDKLISLYSGVCSGDPAHEKDYWVSAFYVHYNNEEINDPEGLSPHFRSVEDFLKVAAFPNYSRQAFHAAKLIFGKF